MPRRARTFEIRSQSHLVPSDVTILHQPLVLLLHQWPLSPAYARSGATPAPRARSRALHARRVGVTLPAARAAFRVKSLSSLSCPGKSVRAPSGSSVLRPAVGRPSGAARTRSKLPRGRLGHRMVARGGKRSKNGHFQPHNDAGRQACRYHSQPSNHGTSLSSAAATLAIPCQHMYD